MTELSWPFDNSPNVPGSTVSENNWSKMASGWLPTGILKTALLELQVYGDSSGRQVKIRSGRAWIQGAFYESDAEITLPIGANVSGSTRFDRIVVRLNWTTNTLAVTAIVGTPGGAPPAITNTSTIWDLTLASVRVVNGAATIAAGDVTDERGTATVGGYYVEPRVPGAICTSTAHPSTWPEGGQIFELDTSRALINVGSAASPIWAHSGDVDATAASPHHSLGPGSYQAAPGNHNHDALYSPIAHNHNVLNNPTINSASLNGVLSGGTFSASTLSNPTLSGTMSGGAISTSTLTTNAISTGSITATTVNTNGVTTLASTVAGHPVVRTNDSHNLITSGITGVGSLAGGFQVIGVSFGVTFSSPPFVIISVIDSTADRSNVHLYGAAAYSITTSGFTALFSASAASQQRDVVAAWMAFGNA